MLMIPCCNLLGPEAAEKIADRNIGIHPHANGNGVDENANNRAGPFRAGVPARSRAPKDYIPFTGIAAQHSRPRRLNHGVQRYLLSSGKRPQLRSQKVVAGDFLDPARLFFRYFRLRLPNDQSGWSVEAGERVTP